MQGAQFVVPRVVPDIEHGSIHDVSEDFFAAVVQAAQSHIAVDQDGHGSPKSIARLSDALLLGVSEGTAPVVDMGKVDVIDDTGEHFFGLSAVGGLTSCSDDDGGFHVGLIAQFAKRFDVFDNLGMIQSDSQSVEFFGVRAIDTDFDFVKTAVQKALGQITAKQIAVGEYLHTWDTLVFAVFDPLWQLLVDQRFAVAMEVEQTRATFDALLDDGLEDLLLHVGFSASDGRSWAKDAVGLAVVSRLDPNGFRERLTQQGHGICDNKRGDRADGAHERLSESGHDRGPLTR